MIGGYESLHLRIMDGSATERPKSFRLRHSDQNQPDQTTFRPNDTQTKRLSDLSQKDYDQFGLNDI